METRTLEIGVWLNGTPMSYSHAHSLPMSAGSSVFARSTDVRNPAYFWEVGMIVQSEPFPDWLSCDMWLCDGMGTIVGTRRPALIYLGPSDVPVTTVFPYGHVHPIQYAGVWVVTTRAMDRNYELPAPPAELGR